MRVTLATAPDGVEVLGTDLGTQGDGPVVLVLHGGLSDESAWAGVVEELARTHRVISIRRRLYRLELPVDPATAYAREVDDVIAVARTLDAPCLLVGHSSGAVVALETLTAAPELFCAAMLYEPPLATSGPVGGQALARARAQVEEGQPGRALGTFISDIVGMPPRDAWLIAAFSRVNSGLRRFIPRQLDDTECLDRLGVRLDAYAGIALPVVLLVGERSPAHLRARSAWLADVLPFSRTVQLPGQAHSANQRDPAGLAALIDGFAEDLCAATDFVVAAHWVANLVRRIPDDAWAGPGLGDWNLRELVGHTSRSLVTVEEYLGKPAARVERQTTEDYYLAVADMVGADPAAVVERGRAAARALGDDPAAAFEALVARVLPKAQLAGDPLISTIAGGMRLRPYLVTRIFELVVHGLDIAVATGLTEPPPPESALRGAVELAARIAVRTGRGADLLLALTGRRPLPDGFSVV